MKTFKICALFLCVSVFSFFNKAEAQIDVTVNPIGLLFGSFSGGADFAISENFSIEPVIGLTFGNDDLSEAEAKYFGLPITVFGKYYFNPNNGTDKFYASAFVRFVRRSYTVEEDDNSFFEYVDYSNTRFGVGFGIGYKIVSSGGFVFDIGLGAGRAFVDNTKYEDGDGLQVDDLDLLNIMLAGKLAVGYRFGGGR